MLTETKCRSLIDLAIDHAGRRVDGIEVTITGSDISTSRFANNGMTQNQSPDHTEISVRVVKGGKQARLSSDQLSPANVRQLVDNAITVAGYLEKDPDLPALLSPKQAGRVKQVNRYDRATARFSAQQRAAAINEITSVAQLQGLICAGIFATGSFIKAIGNSKGLFRFHKESCAECSVTMRAIDKDNQSESTGWVKAQSTRVADIDAKAMAQRAAEKALASANPVEMPPGKYTVILEPPAVLDLVCFLWSDFTGTSHVDKLSCFLKKVGKKVLGANINITDDPFHPLQAGAPFDGEGHARQVIDLVESGRIKNLVYGRRSAAKLGATPTGHALAEPSAEGEYPLNLVMSGGQTSLDEMIKSTERGILLTRVWYVRDVDPTTKIVTGMTRDGTFLIENGAIKHGIKNFRFNQSLIEMLNQVTALTPSARTAGEEGFPAVVPGLKVEGFHFASVTRF